MENKRNEISLLNHPAYVFPNKSSIDEIISILKTEFGISEINKLKTEDYDNYLLSEKDKFFLFEHYLKNRDGLFLTEESKSFAPVIFSSYKEKHRQFVETLKKKKVPFKIIQKEYSSVDWQNKKRFYSVTLPLMGLGAGVLLYLFFKLLDLFGI